MCHVKPWMGWSKTQTHLCTKHEMIHGQNTEQMSQKHFAQITFYDVQLMTTMILDSYYFWNDDHTKLISSPHPATYIPQC